MYPNIIKSEIKSEIKSNDYIDLKNIQKIFKKLIQYQNDNH